MKRLPMHGAGNVVDHDPKSLAELYAARDARLAQDNRTPAEKWLGDPIYTQSALAIAQAKQVTEEQVHDAMAFGHMVSVVLRKALRRR
jgi:hypothetical protein